MVTQPLMNHDDPVQRALHVNIINTQYQICKISSDLVPGMRFRGIEWITPNKKV